MLKKKKSMKTKDTTIDLQAWVQSVREGTEAIIGSARVTSQKSIDDLNECVRLLEEPHGAEFQWNIDMYTRQRVLIPKPPYVILGQDQQVDLHDEDNEENYDLGNEEDYLKPDVAINSIYLVHIERPPFWALARCFICLLFLPHVNKPL